jgi:signal transduction histidine kinase
LRIIGSYDGPLPKFDPIAQGALPLTRGFLISRAVIDRQTIHVADLQVETDEYPEGSDFARRTGTRTIVVVPLIRAGHAIGAIAIRRTELRPFSARQIEPLKSFADQAVIAFENARLFEAEQTRTRELSEALEQQTATAEVLRVISSSPGQLDPVFQTVLANAVSICGATFGNLFLYEGGVYRHIAIFGAPREYADLRHREPIIRPSPHNILARLAITKQAHQVGDVRASQAYLDRDSATVQLADITGARTLLVVPMLKDNDLIGAIGVYRQEVRPFSEKHIALVKSLPVHIPDVAADAEYTYRDFTRITGARSMLGVPLLRDGKPTGLISLYRTSRAPFTPRQIELMATFADQAVIAIENTRLFEEIAQKSRELEIASQHKSQFVANMSHELRTPLAAILGYAELMQEGFYEPLGPKSMDALSRIRSNGKHLLGLINTVLDIAKIESGQFTLDMGEYAIESVVETARSATESLAQSKKLLLKTEVAKSLPIGLGDEQRLTQVLLNLVGNAIKFTDTGEVRVTAKTINGHFVVSVTDTGPGIPEQERTRIFEQFHQVDSSDTKAKGGTGLGLAIAKQIVEMHGGRIWVESTVGKGSTFQLELPTRAHFHKSTP